jgi:hypothetical protein
MWLTRWFVIGVGRINFNFANLCRVGKMATNEMLSRLETNAITAENLIKQLKFEVTISFQF